MEQFKFTPGGTRWNFEMGRPVVHEKRTDGTHIIHIRPNGKSELHSKMMQAALNAGGAE